MQHCLLILNNPVANVNLPDKRDRKVLVSATYHKNLVFIKLALALWKAKRITINTDTMVDSYCIADMDKELYYKTTPIKENPNIIRSVKGNLNPVLTLFIEALGLFDGPNWEERDRALSNITKLLRKERAKKRGIEELPGEFEKDDDNDNTEAVFPFQSIVPCSRCLSEAWMYYNGTPYCSDDCYQDEHPGATTQGRFQTAEEIGNRINKGPLFFSNKELDELCAQVKGAWSS